MKYCGNCGCQISDEAKFCLKCGAKQEVQQQNYTEPEQEVQQQNYAEPEQTVQQQSYAQPDQSYIYQQPAAGTSKFLWKPAVLLVGIVLIALVLIFVLFKIFAGGGSSTMEGAVEAYYEAICDKDGEALLDITCSDSMVKALEEETGYDKEEIAEAMGESLEYSYEDYSKIKSIKIEDEEEMSKSELKAGLAEIEEETGVNVKISEMYEVEVSFKYYDTYYEEWDEDTEYLMVYKSGSGWYVFPFGM